MSRSVELLEFFYVELIFSNQTNDGARLEDSDHHMKLTTCACL